MTLHPGRLLVGSLLLLGACASTEAPAREPSPAVLRRVAATPGGLRAPTPDPWSLFAPAPGAAARASAAQGPGPRFKPQQSLGSTRLLLGRQQLDKDYWRPSSDHLSFGLETSFEREGDWFGGEGGITLLQDKDEGTYIIPGQGNTKIKVDLTMVEVYGGIHRTFLRESRFRPYLGTGASLFWVDADQTIKPTFGDKVSEGGNQFAYGLYAHGGVSFQVSRNFQIGVDARVVGFTHVDLLAGSSGDVDYRQVAFFIGYGG